MISFALPPSSRFYCVDTGGPCCNGGRIPFHRTDAGRSVGHSHEEDDCTVRALATSAGGGYARAHAALKAIGREDRRGISMAGVIHEIPGYQFHRVWIGERSGGRETLRQFLDHHPNGRFFVRKRLHCFAVVEGVVWDDHERSPREVITHCWTVSLRN